MTNMGARETSPRPAAMSALCGLRIRAARSLTAGGYPIRAVRCVSHSRERALASPHPVDEHVHQAEHIALPTWLVMCVAQADDCPQDVLRADIVADHPRVHRPPQQH